MSAAVLSPLVTKPMTAEEFEDDHIMMNLFESAPSNLQEKESPKEDDISVPSLSDDNDVVMEDVEESTAPAFGGLRNLGNTCYLNSATQMLASLDEFKSALEASTPVTVDADKLRLREEFIRLIQSLKEGETVRPDAFKKAVDERSPLFVGYRQQDAHEFLTTLLDLLDEVYQAPEAASTTAEGAQVESKVTEDEKKPESSDSVMTTKSDEDENSTDEPVMKLTSLPSFSELKVDEISQLLHGDEKKQEMSVATRPEEPHCKLVGGRAVVTDAVTPQLQEASVPVAPTQPAPESRHLNTVSPIDDFFATEVRSRLTCDSCKYSRCQIEKYLHLSIDIGSENGSVEEGLRKFFAAEKREIKCEKCFCESATQTMEISKLPQALLFHFKRFIVDVSPDYSSITYRKNQSSVDFPSTLPLGVHSLLRDLVADDATVSGSNYEIRSIVNHIGSSASCGHYTADASRDYGGERGWTRFNDSNVTRISPNEAMGKSSNAYMVMYELE